MNKFPLIPLPVREQRLFEMFKAERVKRQHYQHECGVLRDELKSVRAAYATLSGLKKTLATLD